MSPRHGIGPAKPAVLVLPNVSGWILGEIARQIAALHGDAYEVWYLSELFARRRPEVLRRVLGRVAFVHALSESAAQLVLETAGAQAPPLLTWIHHLTRWGEVHRVAAAHSRMLVATTPAWRDEILARAPAGTDVRVVSYGVDAGVFRPGPARRAEFGIPEDAFAVGFVAGRPSDADGARKGLDTLREVMARAGADLPRLHLCLVGPGWEGEAAALRAAGISARSLGFIASRRLPALYASLDAYLSTSRVEGGPCTVLEAMACEIPVVSTTVGLVPRAVAHGVSGFTAPAGDAEGLHAGLVALAADPARARAMGRAGRARVLDGLTWRQTLAALAGPYREMAELGSVPAPAADGGAERARLTRRVHAADALVWSAAQVRRREVSVREGVRMLGALWEGVDAASIASSLPVLLRPRSLRAA